MVNTLAARAVIASVAEAARRWTDRNYLGRRQALGAVAARTGYPESVVETAFDSLFMPLTTAAIEATIVAELGSVQVLDDFVRRASGRVRALPIGRVCIVSSRTTIGVALLPAAFALCAGCEVLVKDREDRLIEAFFHTVCELQPALAQRITAVAWNGMEDAVDFGGFDVVLAFGSDDTLAEIASRLPFATRFIPHAAKASAGYIAAATLDDKAQARAIARGAASDALLYDGEGCMSLHVLFIEPGGRFGQPVFTALLRDAFVEMARTYSASPSPTMTAKVALRRDEITLSRAQTRAHSDERASYLLVEESSVDSPPLLLPRTLNLVTVDDPSQAVAYLRRHGIALEALAVSGNGRDYVNLAATCGASRITTFGAMQAPLVGSPHGGRPRIAEFVRWIADET